ncbi:FimV/HubP family polar landmark protein [Balneatrix alpica]|uniref:FimV/HubP family polar landmark protein n=1 Tax=Balneatrix alpica TaxID=75684 RepID=UPI0027382F06|nr:FimV/HubP family polar landmark protein [Balneatrix alpica]
MLRKLATSLLMVGALHTTSAWGLALGEASIGSFLNEPLNAELPLLDTQGVRLGQVRVRLADNQAFKLAGVEPSSLLNALRFQVATRNGQPLVQVTSNTPIDQPYLNFLVEVSWPQGKLVREYTLFLDPPVPVVQLVGAEVNGVRVQAPSGFTTPDQPFSGGSIQRLDNSAPAIPVPVESAKASEPQAGKTSVVKGKKVKVGRKDTLWDIAVRTRPTKKVSPQQVMLAYQRVNPTAFVDGNINRLKQGVSLQVPALAEIEKLSFQEAVQEVARQNRLWKSGGAAKAEPAKAPTLKSEPAKAEPAKANAKEEGQLRVMAPAKEEAGENGELKQKYEDLEHKLSLAQEGLDRSERENAELKSRLDALEQQLETLQKLLTLKDEQLAVLEQEAAKARQSEQEAVQDNIQLAQQLEEAKKQLAAQQMQPAMPTADENMPAEDEQSIEQWLEQIPPMYWIAGAGTLVALLVGTLLLMRRRNSSAEDIHERIRQELQSQLSQQPSATAPAATAAVAGAAAGAAAATAMAETAQDDNIPELDPLEGFDELLSDELDLDMVTDEDDPFNQAEEDDLTGPTLVDEVQDQPEEISLDLDLDASLEDDDQPSKAADEVDDVQVGEFDLDELTQDIELDVSDSPGDDEEAFVQSLLNENEQAAVEEADQESDFDLDALMEEEPLPNLAEEGEPESAEDSDAQADIDSLLNDTLGEDEQDFDLDEMLETEPSADPLDELVAESDDDVLVEDEPVVAEEDNDAISSLDQELDALLAEADQDGFVEEESLGEEDFTFLSGADEVATKLDLARAYIDMEDADGARDILDEVLQEGTDAQKQEAEELLAAIA